MCVYCHCNALKSWLFQSLKMIQLYNLSNTCLCPTSDYKKYQQRKMKALFHTQIHIFVQIQYATGTKTLSEYVFLLLKSSQQCSHMQPLSDYRQYTTCFTFCCSVFVIIWSFSYEHIMVTTIQIAYSLLWLLRTSYLSCFILVLVYCCMDLWNKY